MDSLALVRVGVFAHNVSDHHSRGAWTEVARNSKDTRNRTLGFIPPLGFPRNFQACDLGLECFRKRHSYTVRPSDLRQPGADALGRRTPPYTRTGTTRLSNQQAHCAECHGFSPETGSTLHDPPDRNGDALPQRVRPGKPENHAGQKYSRYPVYKDSIDNVVALVYTKDIFKQDRDHNAGFSLESIMRDATFLPETASLEKTLDTMLQRKTHMVILADEYGGTAGLITLENVLEELVGPIQDEFDRETPEIIKLNEAEYLLDASVTTNEVERLINVELSPMDILSIGAFLLEQLGHIPVNGESVSVNGVEFVVEQVTDRVIDRIRVKRLPPSPDADIEES